MLTLNTFTWAPFGPGGPSRPYKIMENKIIFEFLTFYYKTEYIKIIFSHKAQRTKKDTKSQSLN